MYRKTVLNIMIETASFTIPSPNITENSLGCFSASIIEIAATTSDEQRMAFIRRISLIDREKLYEPSSGNVGLYLVIKSSYIAKYEATAKKVKVTVVPNTPNSAM